MLTPIAKKARAAEADMDLGEQQTYRFVADHMDNDEIQFAMDMAAMDLVLGELAAHKSELERGVTRLAREGMGKRRKAVLKALSRHAANGGRVTPGIEAIARRVVKEEPKQTRKKVRVREHTREVGGEEITVSEHERWLPPGQEPSENEDVIDEVEVSGEDAIGVEEDEPPPKARTQPDGERVAQRGSAVYGYAVDVPQSGYENILRGFAQHAVEADKITRQMAPGMEQFLRGGGPHTTKGWGQRLLDGAEFLAHRGGRLATTAKMIKNYGPIAGTRLAYNYFRYGGYDVGLPPPGSQEWKDKGLPDPGSDPDKAREVLTQKLSKRLPGLREHQLAGDHIPSEGYFVGRDGTVKLHAVGRGKDHYVPFSLKHLKRMQQEQGGEMIRRRSAGGPTVEDLHVGMALGLDRVTTVSNNGVFSIDLTDRSHGLKPEHIQILGRYQQLINRESQRMGARGFDAYNHALGALSLEFPLHFDYARGEVKRFGASDQFQDRSMPQKSLIQEFREMFQGINPLAEAQSRHEQQRRADEGGPNVGRKIPGAGQNTRTKGDDQSDVKAGKIGEPEWLRVAAAIGRKPPSGVETEEQYQEWLRDTRNEPEKLAEYKNKRWGSGRAGGQQAQSSTTSTTSPSERSGLAGRIVPSGSQWEEASREPEVRVDPEVAREQAARTRNISRGITDAETGGSPGPYTSEALDSDVWPDDMEGEGPAGYFDTEPSEEEMVLNDYLGTELAGGVSEGRRQRMLGIIRGHESNDWRNDPEFWNEVAEAHREVFGE